ncbi:MAG: hypothetical protein IPM53_30700 [Anaerolineaceae bacterium]|nr:hypothetical protein [Anaerolineaceae bacterium]
MSIKKSVSLGMFLLLTWLAIMLFNVWVHELGHAITFALSIGWQNNISNFGGTFPTDPAFIMEVVNWLQTSGLTPETFETAHQLQLLEALGQNLPSIRLGVIGGWAGQLALTLIVFLLTRTRAFQEEGSGYGRLFWHGYILVNLAWMGGNWLFMGWQAPTSSDPIVLINVMLQRNPVAIGLLWLLALGIIWLAVRLAHRFGGDLFGVLGLSPVASHRLALVWVATTALSSVLLKLPGTLIPVLLGLLIVLVVPIVYLRRLSLAENERIHAPLLAWQGTAIILAVMLAFLLTNSGIVVFGHNGDTQQLNALSVAYCEQTNCLPAEIRAWFSP